MGHVEKCRYSESPILRPDELKNEIKQTLHSLLGKSVREDFKDSPKTPKTPIKRRSVSRTNSFSDSPKSDTVWALNFRPI